MIQLKRRGLLLLSGAAAGGLAAPALRAQGTDMANLLQGDPRFSEFMDLIVRGSFQSYLAQPGPATIFAPVNEAFRSPRYLMMSNTAQMGGGQGNQDPTQGRATWGMVLSNLVVVGEALPISALTNGRTFRTLGGSQLAVSNSGGVIEISNTTPPNQLQTFNMIGSSEIPPARVVGQELVARNGVIIPINNWIWS